MYLEELIQSRVVLGSGNPSVSSDAARAAGVKDGGVLADF
jgi:hypothetical protein